MVALCRSNSYQESRITAVTTEDNGEQKFVIAGSVEISNETHTNSSQSHEYSYAIPGKRGTDDIVQTSLNQNQEYSYASPDSIKVRVDQYENPDEIGIDEQTYAIPDSVKTTNQEKPPVPDRIKLDENTAYTGNGSFNMRSNDSHMPMNDDKVANKIDEVDGVRLNKWSFALCIAINVVVLMLVLALAGTAIAMVLVYPLSKQTCSCEATTTDMLRFMQRMINHTRNDLEMYRNQVDSLSLRFTELSVNVSGVFPTDHSSGGAI